MQQYVYLYANGRTFDLYRAGHSEHEKKSLSDFKELYSSFDPKQVTLFVGEDSVDFSGEIIDESMYQEDSFYAAIGVVKKDKGKPEHISITNNGHQANDIHDPENLTIEGGEYLLLVSVETHTILHAFNLRVVGAKVKPWIKFMLPLIANKNPEGGSGRLWLVGKITKAPLESLLVRLQGDDGKTYDAWCSSQLEVGDVVKGTLLFSEHVTSFMNHQEFHRIGLYSNFWFLVDGKEENRGLYQKYNIRKSTGEPVDPKARYFVLRYDKHQKNHQNALAAKAALQLYAELIEGEFPDLSRDLVNDLNPEQEKLKNLRDAADSYQKKKAEANTGGYHLTPIQKGTLGELSKIREELDEAFDAEKQDNPVMCLLELSDLLGAVECYLEAKHPSVTLNDLLTMSEATQRAFKKGHRK
jgi:hypothetical protein